MNTSNVDNFIITFTLIFLLWFIVEVAYHIKFLFSSFDSKTTKFKGSVIFNYKNNMDKVAKQSFLLEENTEECYKDLVSDFVENPKAPVFSRKEYKDLIGYQFLKVMRVIVMLILAYLFYKIIS